MSITASWPLGHSFRVFTASLWVQFRTDCPLISTRMSPSLNSIHRGASRICFTLCPYGLSAIVKPKPMPPLTTYTLRNSPARCCWCGSDTDVDVRGNVEEEGPCWEMGDSVRPMNRLWLELLVSEFFYSVEALGEVSKHKTWHLVYMYNNV